MIALGLAIELVAAVLVFIGLALGEQAAAPLWAAVVVALLGLTVTSAGVARARPPLRVLAGAHAVTRPDPPARRGD